MDRFYDLVSFSKGGDFLDHFEKIVKCCHILILDPKQNMNVSRCSRHVNYGNTINVFVKFFRKKA